jgi:hypothetical protein
VHLLVKVEEAFGQQEKQMHQARSLSSVLGSNVPNIFQLDGQAFEECSRSTHVDKLTCLAWCKAVRPGHSVRPKIRLTESATDLITILRYFFSFDQSLRHKTP